MMQHTERLRDARAEHAELERREQRVGHAHLVKHHGPDRGIAAIRDQRRALGEHALAHVRDVRGIHRHLEVLQLLVELRALGADRLAVLREAPPARVQVGTPATPFDRVGERGQEQSRIGERGDGGRSTRAEHVAVDVDLHHALLRRTTPVGRLAPPVGLAEPGAHHQRNVGVVAHLVVELDQRHRDREIVRLGQHAPRGPARRDRRAEQLRDATQFVVGAGVDHAAAGVNDRLVGRDEQVRRLLDLVGRGHERVRSAELRRLPGRHVDLDLAVHDRLGHVEVHDARPPLVAVTQRRAPELRDAVERDDGVAPLGEVLDRADLVERLVGPAPVGIDDLRPPAARDREHAVALGVLDDQPRQQVGDAGPVARHADAEPAREPRVGTGHVRGAGLVPRRHDLDAELVQVRIEAEIRAVDDAEDLLDAFGQQHAREDFAAVRAVHV